MKKLALASVVMIALCGICKADEYTGLSSQIDRDDTIRRAYWHCTSDLIQEPGCDKIAAAFRPIHERDIRISKENHEAQTAKSVADGRKDITKALSEIGTAQK
jgi:hypothetical protein